MVNRAGGAGVLTVTHRRDRGIVVVGAGAARQAGTVPGMDVRTCSTSLIGTAVRLPTPALAFGIDATGELTTATMRDIAGYWPDWATSYRTAAASGLLAPGAFLAQQTTRGGWLYGLVLTADPHTLPQISDIQQSVEAMSRHAATQRLTHVAIGRLGLDYGLDWNTTVQALRRSPGNITLVTAVPLPQPPAAREDAGRAATLVA